MVKIMVVEPVDQKCSAGRVAVVYDFDNDMFIVPAKRDLAGSNVPRTFSSTPIEVIQVQFDTTCEWKIAVTTSFSLRE